MRYFCPNHSGYFITIRFGDFEEFIDNQNQRRLSTTIRDKRQNDDFREFNFFNESRTKNIRYLESKKVEVMK